VEVAVAHGSDLPRVRALLREAALTSPRVDAGREPVVLVTRLSDTGVGLQLIFWARDYAEQGLAQSDVHEEIERRFRADGVALPSSVHRIVLEAPTGAPQRAPEV
jgi:small-conductance mechanosensitive channel